MGIEQYRVVVSFDEEKQAYVAKVPELPLMPEVVAESRSEVIAKLDEAMEIGAKLTIEQDGQLPPAIDTDESFSGHIEADIGKSLHKDLAFKARREGIDLDKAILAAISAYVCRYRHPGLGRGKGRDEKRDENVDGNNRNYEGRRFYNPREGSDTYRTLMEDGASFREFLRQQERGARPMRRRRNNNNNNSNGSSPASSNNNSDQ